MESVKEYSVFVKLPTMEKWDNILIYAEDLDVIKGTLVFYSDSKMIVAYAPGFWAICNCKGSIKDKINEENPLA